MPASYYVVTDAPEDGLWDFTREQIAAVLEQRWPHHSRVTGPFPPHGVIELRIRAGQTSTLVTYFPGTMFTFDDQDDLAFPIEVVYHLLTALAPTASAMWSSDSDPDVYPFDLSGGLETAIADMLGA